MNIHNRRFELLTIVLLCIFFLTITCQRGIEDQMVWLRGNLHTHTFWSDGNHFPESVAKWYQEMGYNFLVFTDHNILMEVQTSEPLRELRIGQELVDGHMFRRLHKNHKAIVKYFEDFGEDWADYEYYAGGDSILVRIKTLEEFRNMFEEPEEFLLIQGNEISDKHAVHAVTIHMDKVLPITNAIKEERVFMIRQMVEHTKEYREQTGRNVWPILAHPNFQWAITAEMMLDVDELRFFEMYNGHPIVNNDGDGFRVGAERMWDIVLAMRLGSGKDNILYGVATDDAHSYHGQGASPGRGWVMVRSNLLKPESILDALDRGDFYSSTGVFLKDIVYDDKTIRLSINDQAESEYITEFIGTRKGFDNRGVPTLDAEGNEIEHTTMSYSDEIGIVLAISNELNPEYKMTGDELYVRVRVTSSADQLDQITGAVIGKKRAWSQPFTP